MLTPSDNPVFDPGMRIVNPSQITAVDFRRIAEYCFPLSLVYLRRQMALGVDMSTVC